MRNSNKVVTAGSNGFTVYYTDTQKHFRIAYDQPLLPYLQKLQLYGDSYKGRQYQSFEVDAFSALQNRLYKDAVYGLNSYSVKQIRALSFAEKRSIINNHKTAEKILNRWKQELVVDQVDLFLSKLFPRSSSVKKMVEATKANKFCRDHVNKMRFSDLNLSRTDIANKLIQEGILPANFFKKAA